MKTMMISILCLLAFIAQTVKADDPAAKLSTKLAANRKEILDAINKCRRNVQPPATDMLEVEWSEEAEATALKYAQGCIEKHSVESQRKLPSGYDCGENLFYSTDARSWTFAIEAFCNESKYFVHGKGPTTSKEQTGHYTQLVWYRSRLVGCAVAHCPKAEYAFFYVCHQCPPGNYADKINTPYTAGKTCAACPNNYKNGLCTNPCKFNTEFTNCGTLKQYCKMMKNVKEGCPGTCGCTNGEII